MGACSFLGRSADRLAPPEAGFGRATTNSTDLAYLSPASSASRGAGLLPRAARRAGAPQRTCQARSHAYCVRHAAVVAYEFHLTLGAPADYGCCVIGRIPSGLTTGRRILAAAVALAMFTVTVGGLAHRAVVEHVACEHGQLVELSSERAQAREHSVVGTSADHEHHHCALASFRCAGNVEHTAPRVGSALVVSALARLSSSAPVRRATLREAPKTSPPA